LVGIPPAPRGIPRIEVTFDIDVNGIAHVSARDTSTGQEQRITITASCGLKKDEIDRMIRDAEQHAEEDRRKREEQEIRNRADSVLYDAEKLIREAADKITEEQKARVNAGVEEVGAALASADAQRISDATDALTTIVYEVGAAMYQAAEVAVGAETSEESAGGEQTAEADGGEVIEGEIKAEEPGD
jgi:molecular chaperone DnaK